MVAEVALAQDFHADYTFACGLHLFDYADDRVWVGVHVGADGIDADEVNVNPGRCRGGAQSFDGMAGAAVGADDALVLGFFEDIHDGAIARGPIGFGEAVHEENVDVVDAEFAAEAIEVGAHFGGVARPGFGEHGDVAAVDVLESFGNVRMTAVGVRGVEKMQALMVAVEQQTGEAVDAEGGLVGVVANTNGAGAHGEATGDDAGVAERNAVGGVEFFVERGDGQKALGEGVRG